jgi:hypothetical protein
MKNVTRWFVVSMLAATGVFAFACGGGNSEGGGGTTPSATAPATSAAPSASTAMTATATATTTTAPTPPAPPLTIVAMKMTDPDSKKTYELKADGTVMGPDGKVIGKFVGAEVQDKDGKTFVSVNAAGELMWQGKPQSKFNEKDELVSSFGTVSFTDDGALKMVSADGKADADAHKLKIVGFKPQARRAAAVFLLATIMSPDAPPTTTSATAKKK